MKKKSILVGLLAAGAVIALASCGGNSTQPTETTTQTATAKNLGQKVKVTFANVNPDDSTEVVEKEVTLDKVDASTNTAYGLVEAPNPTNEYKEFTGWYADEALTTEANVSAVTAEATFYAKWNAKYEYVTTGVGNNEGLTSWAAAQTIAGTTGTAAFTKDVTVGNLTFVSNGKARFDKKDKIDGLNTQGASIKVTLSGDGENNEIKADGKYASGDPAKVTLYSVDADGKETEVAHTDEYSGSGTIVSYDWKDLAAGNYIIKCPKSVHYYNIATIEKKEKSPAVGIELETGAVSDYLVGSKFDKTGLVIKKVYKNGSKVTVELDDITIDDSAVNFNESGEYTVSYTLKDTDFEAATQKVKVYAVESIEVQDHILNSSRVTQNLEQVFVKDGKFTSKNLGVIANAAVTVDNVKFEKTFNLTASQYEVTAPALTAAGEKEVTVKYKLKDSVIDTIADTYKVLVVDSKLVSSHGYAQVMVNPNAEEVGVYGSQALVRTVNQALQLFQVSELKDTDYKLIAVKPGVYNEKIEVSLANVYLINAAYYGENTGINSAVFTENIADANKVIFEYDQLAGDLDVNGVKHNTDGSATFSIRSTANNFTVLGVEFKNHYNTNELYNASKLITGDTQAVALLVEGDGAFFANCAISSYHDTLFAREGRQFYYNCYIEGRTDYIFGDRDVTAYFKDCIIHTLGANQDKNGGYVACNKGSKVNLAYVFDNCEFEADAPTEADGVKNGVADASVSLGRTWDKGMRLVIMNSKISSAYAKADFGATTEGGKNTRYTFMTKNENPSKEKIFEYNNTGAGALTAEEASEYTSVSVLAEITDATAPYVTKSWAKLFSNNGTKEWGATWINKMFMTWSIGDNKFYQVAGLEYEPTEVTFNYNSGFGAGFVVDGYISEAWVKQEFSREFEGKIEGIYSDAALTTKFDFSTKVTSAGVNLYFKVVDKAPVSAHTYKADDLSLGDITTEVKLGGNDSIVTLVGSSGKKFTVGTNATKYTVDGAEETTSVNVLKTGGASDSTGRYIKIDLTEFAGKAKLEVFVITGSNGASRTGQIRIDSVSGDVVKELSCPERQEGDAIPNQQVIVNCGHVYYITADASINYYAFAVSPYATEAELTKFDATKKSATPAYDGWTVTMATAGSAQVATTLGYDKDKKDASGTINSDVETVSCPKLVGVADAGDTIKSTKFERAANKIDLVMISSSTGTGDAISCYVDLLAEDGTVVKTVTWDNVTVKKLSTKAELTIESDTAFFYVQIRGAFKTGKTDQTNFNVLSIEGKVYFAA